VSWLAIALLLGAVAVLVAAEWPRLDGQLGRGAVRRRRRARQKASLRIVEPEDEFAESVRRDLDRLPTYDPPRDRR
jgi:hypothetical protein